MWKKISPDFRKLSLMVITLVIISAFVSVYYFNYVTKREAELKGRGFRILKKIEQNIRDKHFTYQQSSKIKAPMLTMSDSIGDTIQKINSTQIASDLKLARISRAKSIDSTFFSLDPLGNKLHYGVKNKNGVLAVFQSYFSEFIAPILDIRNDLFEGYFIVRTNGDRRKADTIIYYSPQLSFDILANDFDSIVTNRQGIKTNSIRDIELSGSEYKVFLHPLQLQSENLLLAGVIKKKNYNSRFLSVPPDLIYKASIVLFLLVLALPFCKIILMSPLERLTIFDVAYLIVSVFFGVSLLIVVLSDMFFYRVVKKYDQRDLRQLSSAISSSFKQELDCAYEQMVIYDTMARSDSSFQQEVNQIDPTKSVLSKQYFPGIYKNFDFVFWADNEGKLKAKWHTTKNETPYSINVSTRDYFKKIVENQTYSFSNCDTCEFYIESVFSWITGENLVAVSKRSTLASDFKIPVITLASRFHSALAPVIPEDLGFCIIDVKGKVLFHSDSKKNLKENFLEECNDDKRVYSAIRNRECHYLSNISYYGEINSFFICPMDNLPLHVVTFSKQRFHEANFRILTFTISLLLLSLLLLLVIFYVVRLSAGSTNFEASYTHSKYLWYRPLDIPGNVEYVKIFWLLAAFVVLFSICFLLISLDSYSLILLFFSFLTPFYALIGVFKLKDSKSNKIHNRVIFSSGVLILIVNLGFLNFLRTELLFASNFLWLIGLQLIYILVILAVKKTTFVNTRERRYLRYYCGSLVLFLLVVSVIPVFSYFFFSCFIEREQLIRNRQLHLSEQLREKYQQQSAFSKKLKAGLNDKDVQISSLLNEGVYSLDYKLKLDFDGKKSDSKKLIPTDKLLKNRFYSSFFSKLVELDDYYTLGGLDKTSRDMWYWKEDKNDLSFVYNNFLKDKAGTKGILSIVASVPSSKDYFEVAYNDLFLFILILLFLILSVYLLAESTIRKIFLLEYYEKHQSNIEADELLFDQLLKSSLYNLLIISPPGTDVLEVVKTKLTSFDELNFRLLGSQVGKGPLEKKTFVLPLYDVHLQNSSEFTSFWQKIEELAIQNRVIVVGPSEPSSILAQLGSSVDKSEMNALEEIERLQSFKSFLTLYYPLSHNGSGHPSILNSKPGLINNLIAEDNILRVQRLAHNYFCCLWESCTKQEKYVLYDLAADGLTNYKNQAIISTLLSKGLVSFDRGILKVFDDSFNSFILSIIGPSEAEIIEKEVNKSGRWSTFKIPIMIVLLAAGAFLFVTQEETSRKIVALVTSLGAIIPLLVKMLTPDNSAKTKEHN